MKNKKDAVSKGLSAVLGGSSLKNEEKPKPVHRKTTTITEVKTRTPAKRSTTRQNTKPKTTCAKKKPGEAAEGKAKVTYYINQDVVKQLKHLAVDFGAKDSALVEEAMQDLVKKYNNK